MGLEMPPRERDALSFDVQMRTRAGTTPHPHVAHPAAFRRPEAHCGSCGGPWFGDVAYCPYCGHPAASARVATDAGVPGGRTHDGSVVPFATFGSASAEHPGGGRKPIPLATVIAIGALAMGVLAVGMLAFVHRGGTSEAGAEAASSAAASMEPSVQQQAPARPVGPRSLCSPANQAAGLCNPQ